MWTGRARNLVGQKLPRSPLAPANAHRAATTPLNVVRIASHSSTGMKKRTLARTLGIEDAEAGAGAILVACRLAGLSALEAHYAGVN
jgi:hypothetical protein